MQWSLTLRSAHMCIYVFGCLRKMLAVLLLHLDAVFRHPLPWQQDLCKVCINYVSMVFKCLSLHLFSYLVPAGDQRSVEHLTLRHVPVDVVINLLSFFSEVTQLECHSIHAPQEVQFVHMYSVAWDALVFRTNHCLAVF